jgi:prepilin peptidase CpaA
MVFPVFDGTPAQTLIPLAVLATACVTAAWLDVRYRRIPNLLCAGTAIAGLVVAVLLPSGAVGLASHALHMLIALIGGMILFRFGILGGGDAKFYTAVAAWFALGKGALLLVDVALCGLVLLIFWFVYRRVMGYPIRRSGGSVFDGLPYGLAIGTGAITAYLL